MLKLLSYTELVKQRSQVENKNADLVQVAKAQSRKRQIVGNAVLAVFPGLETCSTDDVVRFAEAFREFVMNSGEYSGDFAGLTRDEVFESFWNRVQPTFINDLIPVTMLFDCYVSFCDTHSVNESVRLRRNQFFKYVKSFVDTFYSDMYVVPTDAGSDVRGISLAPGSWVLADEPMVLDALALCGRSGWATRDPQVENLARWLPPFLKRDLFKPRGGIFVKSRYEWCKRHDTTPKDVLLSLDVTLPECPDFDIFLESRQADAMLDYHRDYAEQLGSQLDLYKDYVDSCIAKGL